MKNGPWILLIAAAAIAGSAITLMVVPPVGAHISDDSPWTIGPNEPMITGICETCDMVLPWAEVKRIRFCPGHRNDEGTNNGTTLLQ